MKLGTALYRDLLRNGKKFDRFPVLKACLIYKKTLPIGDVFESEWKELISLKNGHYYKPGIQFQDEIRKRFQQAKTLQKDSPDLHKLIDLGFATLKRLNTILTKTKGMVPHERPFKPTTSSSETNDQFARQFKVKKEPDDIDEMSLKNGGFLLIANPCDPFNRWSTAEFANGVILVTHHDDSKIASVSTVGLILNKTKDPTSVPPTMTGGPCPWKKMPPLSEEQIKSEKENISEGELLWRLDDNADVLKRIDQQLLAQKQQLKEGNKTPSNFVLRVEPTKVSNIYRIDSLHSPTPITTSSVPIEQNTETASISTTLQPRDLQPTASSSIRGVVVEGYSAWVRGQLQEELDRGSWIPVSLTGNVKQILSQVSSGHLLGHEEGKKFYRGMLRALGGEYAKFADMVADASAPTVNIEITTEDTENSNVKSQNVH